MAGYGWDEYDIRRGGRQSIRDAENSVDITIDFVKVPGGQHGGSWAARVKGVPREDAPEQLYTSVIFYASIEGMGSLEVETADSDPTGFEGDVRLNGFTLDLGTFTIDVTAGPESNEHPIHDHPSYADKPLSRTIVQSILAQVENLWQVKSTSSSTAQRSISPEN
jgi:mannosyl-oligosaccharide glucosidase